MAQAQPVARAILLFKKLANKTQHSVDTDNINRGIVPAETASRKAREGKDYKEPIDAKKSSIDTTAGSTIGNEGLANNYAIEPEICVEETGNMKDSQQNFG